MDIEFKQRGYHRILSIHGEFDFYDLNQLKKELFSAIDETCISIVIDMKEVNHMNSSMMGLLVAGCNKMKAHNGEFALVNIHKDILKVIRLAMLDKLFKIYENEDDLI
jgi:anti-sigma B factor antagonist